jgi:zeaxanthin glucosyltransferase
MRVLICVLPEPGHLNPTYPLARALQARRHEVVYLSSLDMQASVEARGFRCVPIHRTVWARNAAGEAVWAETPDERQRALHRGRLAILEDYLNGTIETIVRRLAPDLVLADVIPGHMAHVACRMGVACLMLNTAISHRYDELPPLTSDLLPDASPLALEDARWRSSCIGSSHVVTGVAFQAACRAARFAYPVEHVSLHAAFVPALTLYREVVLYASAYDFPRKKAEGPLFLACPVDLERNEDIPAALASFLDGRPLVFASLGSQSGRYAWARSFIESVVGLAGARSDLQVVIVMGARHLEQARREAAGGLPENLLALEYAPQLWTLRRSAVFVTHGGLGSVREGIALSVPMIAVPQLFDQPGNAARVEYHGVGLRIAADEITASRLGVLVERILSDQETFKRRLRALDERCRAEERDDGRFEIIERTAAPRRGPPELDASEAGSDSPGSVLDASAAATLGWMFVRERSALPHGDGWIHAPGGEPVGVGASGFTAWSDPFAALFAARGCVLARIELAGDRRVEPPVVVGRSLRCLWTLDATRLLYDFAEWAAGEISTSSATHSAIQEHRALVGRGEREEALAHNKRLRDSATWFDGTAAALCATHWDAEIAAMSSGQYAIDTLAYRRVTSLAGTAEGADAYVLERRIQTQRFGSELLRRVVAEAQKASLTT